MNRLISPEEEEWYGYIDSLAIKFQDGDADCGMELIDIFYPFLNKYNAILRDGKLNLNDVDARKFIGLFISDQNIVSRLNRHWQSAEVRSVAYRTANYVAQSCNALDDDDIRQEIYIAFLTIVNRWVKKKEKSFFTGYMYNSFRYELQRSIASIIRNPIVNSGSVTIHYNDDEGENSEYEELFNINTEDTMMISLENVLDTNWVRGLTCSEEFLDLTVLERMILKDYYSSDLSDREIAAKTGMHINTINRKRHKAIEVLDKHYGHEDKTL